MSLNQQAFNGRAANYAKGRPGYPAAVHVFLAEQGVGTGKKVADIGSGTGIFSKVLLDLGAEVWGVEINDEMRMQAEIDLQNNHFFHSLSGSAEATGLLDSSVDFISAAQAFHWFDKEKFQIEARRILKPGGKIILLWNCEKLDNLLFEEWGKIQLKWINQRMTTNEKYSPQEFFIEPGRKFLQNCREFRCPNIFYKDKESFLAQALSSSAAPLPADKNYQGYHDEVNALFERLQENGKLLYPCETVVLIGEITL